LMGVVASSTSQSRVLGIVAAAVEQTIRLKSYVVDASQVGHHRHGVHTAMASPAELLRKSFGIKLFRIENIQALSWSQEHHCGMGLCQHVMNRLPVGFFPVAYTIRVWLAVAYGQAGARPGFKSHPRVGSQHIALGSSTQGMPHRRVGLPEALLQVTTSARLSD